MAPEIQAVVRATQAWLQSSWHVQVPFAWLEACVEWLREEAGGTGRLSQQQINQQVLDQWLLTDLRDLDFPVLPEGLAAAHKTELSGTFCVQVDSLLDASQPAYTQLQKWKGTDCANDEVSAVTQTTQRPWEAKPTRMLLLQVTDGVQNLEAMEYQPIPALSTELRPGVKLQLQGKIVCRLGMLLLGPSNVKVLGGEVEDLVERNNQGRVLCRTLGLPEEQQPQQQQQQQQQPPQEEEDAPLLPQQGYQEMEDLELDDAELLAGVEAQEEVGRPPVGLWSVPESGYGTLSQTYSQSSRASSVRSHVSAASSRIQQEVQSFSMPEEDFPDEDFDDLPLDELDSEIFQEATDITGQSDSSHRWTPQNSGVRGNPNTNPVTRKRDYQGQTRGATGELAAPTSTSLSSPAALEASHEVAIDESDFMDEDMDCFLEEAETYGVQPERSGGDKKLPVQQGLSRDRESAANTTESPGCSYSLSSKSLKSVTERPLSTPQGQTDSVRLPATKDPESESTVPALTLASPPFTYLRLLEDRMSKPQSHATEIRVKAFIVTLSGKLTSNKGVWSICAAISDGTGYLDVELSDEVLTSLLGFSVAEKAALKRDPARRGELDAGMRRCQEKLVDMCCIMTISVEPGARKAVVTRAEEVSEKVLQELEQRVKDRRR